MTFELSFELLATHQLERGRLYASTVHLGSEGALAIEVQEGTALARVWDAHTGELVLDLPADTFLIEGQENRGIDAAVSGDGSKLAIARWYLDDSEGQYSGSLRVLDTRTGSVLVSETLGSPWSDTAVRFSEDGRFLFYANKHDFNMGAHDQHNQAGVIEVETGSDRVAIDFEDVYFFCSGVDHVQMQSPNGGRVALWDDDVTRIWDVGERDRSADPSSPALSGMLIPKNTFGISDAVFSSDGSLVLTSGGDGSARTWNVETGAELLKLDHGRHVLRGRFSCDGSRILTACAGGAVRLWDARNGDLIALLADGGGFESQIVFGSDGLRCATGGSDGVVRFWSSATGKPLGERARHPDAVSSIVFTRDGERLVSASASEILLSEAESGVTCARIDGKLLEISVEHDLIVVGGETFMQLCDTRDGSVVWALNRGMTHAAISPDGARLLCWDEADGDIHDFDVVSGAPVGLFGGPRQGRGSTGLSFNRDGSRVLIFEPGLPFFRSKEIPGFTVRLCDSADGSVIATFERATAVAFSPDGSSLCCRPQGEAPVFFDATNGGQIGGKLDFPFTFDGDWTGMEFGPDAGRLILFGMDDRPDIFGTGQPVARIYDAQTGNKVSKLSGHTAPKVLPVEFDPSGERLLTIDDHTMVRVWEAATGRELAVLHEQYCDKVRWGGFSPDSAWVLTSINGQTLVYDSATGANVAVLTGDKPEFGPDGARVLTCASEQTQVWDAVTWSQLAVLPGTDPTFSPDGTRALTRTGGQTHVWDTATWSELAVLTGYRQKMSNPDGTRVLLTGGGQTHVWDAVTWSELAVLPGNDPTFSPDGTRALTQTEGQTHVWDTATWSELAVLAGGSALSSTDGTRLLTHDGKQTHVWDTATWTQLAVLAGSGARFAAEGARLLTSVGWETHVWDAATWSELAVLAGSGARFTADGTRALTENGDQTHVWDTETWKQLAVLVGKDLSFNSDESRAETSAGEQTLMLWDAATWKQLGVLPRGSYTRGKSSPDGTPVLKSVGEQTHVLDWKTENELAVLEGSVQCFFAEGTRLFTTVSAQGGRGQTYVWDTATWKKVAVLPGQYTSHLSPDGTRVLKSVGEQTHVWDTATWTQLAILAGIVPEFSADGTRVLTMSHDRTHRWTDVWDTATWTQLAVLKGSWPNFSTDGTRVLTTDDDQTRVWDAGTWTQLAVLPGFLGFPETRDARFSNDGTRLLTASGVESTQWDSGRGQTHVWDTTTWTQLAVLAGGGARFTADGTRLLTHDRKQIYVWDSATGTQLAVLPGVYTRFFDERGIFVDLTRVLTTDGNQIRVWDTATWTQLAVLPGDKAEFSLDRTRVFVTDGSQTRVWDTESWTQLAILAGRDAVLASNGTRVLTRAGEPIRLLWDAATWMQLAVLPGGCSRTFSPDGTRMLSSVGEQTHVWDTATWTQLAVLAGRNPMFTSDGTQLLTMSYDGTHLWTHVWETGTWMQLTVLAGRHESFTSDGTRLFTISYDEPHVWTHAWTHVWETGTWTELAVLPGKDPTFSPDGTWALTRTGDQTHVWDTAIWSELAVLPGDVPTFSPDGTRAFTRTGDRTHVWDTRTWTQLATRRGGGHHKEAANGRYLLSVPAWGRPCISDLEKGGVPIPLVGRNDTPVTVTEAKHSPDGSLILTTGDDGRIRLWDPVSGSVVETIHAETTRILAGAKFSPDGKTVLAACGDCSLRLWDVSSGRQLAVMEGRDSTIDAFSFSADGQQIVTVSGSTLRRWGPAEE